MNPDINQHIALILPVELDYIRQRLRHQAQTQRKTAKDTWGSLRQANWLADVATRATRLKEITTHIEKQGKRWHEKPTLANHITQEIGEKLRHSVVEAIESAANKVTPILSPESIQPYKPDPTWVTQEQLKLARFYIGLLTTQYRIDIEG